MAHLRALIWTTLASLLATPLIGFASDLSPNAAFREIRKIVTPRGIQQEEFVEIGGTRQWISIRARDRDAPIMLVIHGGPGFTLSPVTDYFMRDWEEFFTVVQWDQRAAGKSYRRDEREKLAPTLTIDRFVLDAEELIEYLRKRFDRERVVVLAHSFGTIVGAKLAQRRPDLLYAYVGMGQFVDFEHGEKLGYEATLADARADSNEEAIAQLEAIAPFPDPEHPERNLENLPTERRWLAHYGGYFKAGGFGSHEAVARLSPTHSAADLEIQQEGHDFIVEHMWDEVGTVSLLDDVKFDVPIVIMQGRYDRGTSSQLAAAWYAKIVAPAKKLIWFDESSHMVFEEEPGKLLVSLVNEVLPLTRTE